MKKLSAVVKLPAEINMFVAVTNGLEFCLETALLFNDTHNIGGLVRESRNLFAGLP